MLKLLRVIFYFVLILVTPHIALADSTTVVLSFPAPGPSPRIWPGMENISGVLMTALIASTNLIHLTGLLSQPFPRLGQSRGD